MTRLEIRPSLLLVFTLALSCKHILNPPGLFCWTKVTHGRVGGGGGCYSGGYVNEKRKKKKFTREFPFYQGKNSRLPSERDWRGSNGLMTPLASSPFFPAVVSREKKASLSGSLAPDCAADAADAAAVEQQDAAAAAAAAMPDRHCGIFWHQI